MNDTDMEQSRADTDSELYVVKLDTVIRHYVDGLHSKDAKVKILSVDHWVDITKGDLVLRIFTQTEETK